MRFGLTLTLSERYAPGVNMMQSLRQAAYLVRMAREYGFEGVFISQHYLTYPHQTVATVPALSRLAAEAEGMTVGPMIILLPLHAPVQVAEEMATLDAITGGRSVLGVGQGYREEEFAAFGIDPRERVGRLFEGLDLIKQLWTKDEVAFEGKYYHVPPVKPTAKPVQRPHPPIWVAANVDRAVRRIGRLGYTWVINPHSPMSFIAPQVEMYRAALHEHGHSDPAVLPMRRDVYLAEDMESAFREAGPLLGWRYDVYQQWGQDKALAEGDTFSLPFQELAQDRFIVGTPEECVEACRRYEAETGVNYLIVRMHYVGMPFEDKVRQLRLFGEGVIPRFKE